MTKCFSRHRETNRILFFNYYYRALACSTSSSNTSIPPIHASHGLVWPALPCCDHANHFTEVLEPSSGLRYRATSFARASDPLSKEVKQVRNRQEGCSNPGQDGRCMVHAEVLVHRYGHNHHAARYHVADQRDRHQRRRSIFREGLDDVHVD